MAAMDFVQYFDIAYTHNRTLIVYMHNRTFSPSFELKVCLGMQIFKMQFTH